MARSTCGRKPARRRSSPRSWGNNWLACWPRAGRERFWKRYSGPVGEAHYKPLAGKRVVVTRAAEQCQSLVDALRAAGAEPVVVPVVAFQMPEDVAVLDDCLKTPGRFDWVFLASQNAVRALQERWATLALRGVD